LIRILVVDDEKIERDGILFLLRKRNIDLDILEAANGQDALAILEKEPVDILLTDIRMPFLDGLDLSFRARQLLPDLVVIIFSAYGEFDYAKRAIDSHVQHYLLKPIDPEEFYAVVQQALDRCKTLREARLQDQRLREVVRKGMAYEKESLLFDLFNGAAVGPDLLDDLRRTGVSLEAGSLRLVLIDTKDRFFDRKGRHFEAAMARMELGSPAYLNVNEYQSVLLLAGDAARSGRETLETIGRVIVREIESLSDTTVCLLVGTLLPGPDRIYEELRRIESLSDIGFFHDHSVVLHADDQAQEPGASPEHLDRLASDIRDAIAAKDSFYAQERLDRLFDFLQQGTAVSPVYIKYLCAGILRALVPSSAGQDRQFFIGQLEKMFGDTSLQQLREDLTDRLREAEAGWRGIGETGGRRVIEQVIRIIEQEYGKDLSLEYIAAKVYLTPTYLSHLFKQETGTTLLKYLTSYRMDRACRFLRETNKRVADICTEVGYGNLSYFCAIFKSNFKTTPAKYREAGR